MACLNSSVWPYPTFLIGIPFCLSLTIDPFLSILKFAPVGESLSAVAARILCTCVRKIHENRKILNRISLIFKVGGSTQEVIEGSYFSGTMLFGRAGEAADGDDSWVDEHSKLLTIASSGRWERYVPRRDPCLCC